MGSDSRDLFAEISYRFNERGDRVAVAYDREEHNLSKEVRAKKDEASVRMEYNVMKNLKVSASYGHGRLKNFEDVPRQQKERRHGGNHHDVLVLIVCTTVKGINSCTGNGFRHNRILGLRDAMTKSPVVRQHPCTKRYLHKGL